MSAIIEQLNQEHANMSRILDLLEHEIETFGRGEVADFHLVQEIMDYCLDYPEACHHPKEDAIYAVMIDRRPNLADEIADLSGAHAKQRRAPRRARDGGADHARRDLARDLVLDVFGTFLDSYRLHIKLEEENFFPEAARLLNDADWARVAQTLADRPNPLLIDAGDGRFATLRQGILHIHGFSTLWIAKLHLPKIGLPL